MSHLMSNYQRADVAFVKAEGNQLFDREGNAYLDFSSGIGVTNLGFHPQVVAALQAQVQELWHSTNLYQSPLQEEVAALLVGEADYKVFFCNSGAESNEAAIKLARKATGKSEIISFQQSFHGRTFGAMSATGQSKIQEGFGPLLPGFQYATFNQIDSVKSLVRPNTAAVLLELIQGESGVHPAEPAFIRELADLCQSQGILLVVDEVQTGMGRTGSLYAYEQYGIEPDIISLAKGLANGVPAGVILAKTTIAQVFQPGSHGSTFGGNPLAMAASLETLKILKSEGFLEEVTQKAAAFMNQLMDMAATSDQIVEIRGQGFMIGIEVKGDPKSLVTAAREEGLILLTAGEKTLRLLPPLTLTSEEMAQGLAILHKLLK